MENKKRRGKIPPSDCLRAIRRGGADTWSNNQLLDIAAYTLTCFFCSGSFQCSFRCWWNMVQAVLDLFLLLSVFPDLLSRFCSLRPDNPFVVFYPWGGISSTPTTSYGIDILAIPALGLLFSIIISFILQKKALPGLPLPENRPLREGISSGGRFSPHNPGSSC